MSIKLQKTITLNEIDSQYIGNVRRFDTIELDLTVEGIDTLDGNEVYIIIKRRNETYIEQKTGIEIINNIINVKLLPEASKVQGTTFMNLIIVSGENRITTPKLYYTVEDILEEDVLIESNSNIESFIDLDNFIIEAKKRLSEYETKVLEISSKIDALNNKIDENIQLNNFTTYEGTDILTKNSLEGQVGEYTIRGNTLFKMNEEYIEQWQEGAILESMGEIERNINQKYPIIIKSCGKNLINSGTNYSEIKNALGLTHPYASQDGVKLIVGGANRFVCIKVNLNKDTFYTISCNIRNKNGLSRVLFYYILDGQDNYESEILINLDSRVSYKFKSSISDEYELKFYYGGTAEQDETCILSDFQLENGEVCTEYEKYMENKGVILLDEPLRGLKTEFDEIVNKKLIRNIGVREYENNDENLSEVITDKFTTIYKLKKSNELAIESLSLSTYNNITNIIMENKIKGILNIKVLSNIKIIENSDIEEVIVGLQNQTFSINKALKDLEQEVFNISQKNVVGIKYNDPILNGAKGDGINDDSIYFNEKYNYLDEGKIFLINKEVAKSLKTSIGKGSVVIKDFPYILRPNQPQGKFSMEYINDEVIMDMNLPNEALPHGTGPRQQVGGSFPFDDIKMPEDYDILNPWGQIYIVTGEDYPVNAVLHIKNMALIVLKKSTQNWEIINDINDIDGGYFIEDYSNENLLSADITRYRDEICVKIDSSMEGRCFHFWTKKVMIEDPTDILYVTVYVDAWISGDNVDNKFVFDVGADYKQSTTMNTREAIVGRFKLLKTYQRRAYATNLNYDKYGALCSQMVIDNISQNKHIYDVKSGNIMLNDIQYNPSIKKLMILKDKDVLYSRTIDNYAEINPFSKIYIPSRRDYGSEDYYLKIGLFNLTETESDECTINLEIFSDVQICIYAKLWISIKKGVGAGEIPTVTFIQINSYDNLSFDKRMFAIIDKKDNQNYYTVTLYLTKFPSWTPCHMYIDITSPRLDSFEFNEYILKPYSNYIDEPDLYWKNDALTGEKVEFVSNS